LLNNQLLRYLLALTVIYLPKKETVIYIPKKETVVRYCVI